MVDQKDSVDLNALLDNVSWGHRIVEIQTEDGLQTFALRPLTIAERNAASFVYAQAFRLAIENGMPTQDQLMVDANSVGLWHPEKDKHLEGIQQDLSDLYEELEKAQSARQAKSGTKRVVINEKRASKLHSKEQKLINRIKRLQANLVEMKELRFGLIEHPSAEHQASHERAVHVIQCATMTFPGLQQKWPSIEDIKATSETNLVFRLIGTYNQISDIEITHIRALARYGMWRIRWSTAKSVGAFDQLFDVSLSDLTPDQLLLIHWSQVYDSAYEAYERPPDYVIDDDKEFDRWLDKTIKEQEQERKKRFQSNKGNLGIGKASNSNADEIFVPTDGYFSDDCICGAKDKRGVLHAPDCQYGVFFRYKDTDRYKEIDNVQSTNPDAVRVVLASEQKALDGKGLVREENLRRYGGMARQIMGLKTNVQGGHDKRR